MWKKRKEKLINVIIVMLLLAYFAVGVLVYRDYGISSDEPTERISTLVNVKYVLNFFGADHMSEYDRHFFHRVFHIPHRVPAKGFLELGVVQF